MKKEITVTAKTVEEAVIKAVEELGAPSADKIEYTVKVVDQNGDAVVGMSIQLCPNGVCLAEKFVTDANGEITVKLNAGSAVDVKLEALEGYVLPVSVNDPYHAVIAAGETEITITVTKN